ncbi:MAG TPA: hypothetical protein PK559_15370 [Ignavibacteriaceae bacterium]|nr:hypothetical protein [Ignavibacteriaceae bacterium]
MEFLAELHPKVVHFPIALLMTYTLFEIIGTLFKKEVFTKSAYFLLLLGVIGAIVAAQTGEQAESVFENWTSASGNLLEEHEKYANITIWYFAILLVLRTLFVIYVDVKKKFIEKSAVLKFVFVLLALLGCYFVYLTGEYGGKMVYDHGVGTKPMIEEVED